MDEFPEVDYVFHLAAQAGVRNPGEKLSIRTSGIMWRQLKSCWSTTRIRTLKKFVYSSSSSVYGNVSLPMTEESVLRPVSPYGVTKLAAENLCQLYTKNYGLPSVSLRYFTVYGPRLRPDLAISKFVAAIRTGTEITSTVKAARPGTSRSSTTW